LLRNDSAIGGFAELDKKTNGSAKMITQKELLERFDYQDGELYLKEAIWGHKVGQKIGCVDSKGYVKTTYKKKSCLVHRFIFMMHHGYLPKQIDHINLDKTDNRIENLRAATRSENLRNRSMAKSNKSGVKNVHWLTKNKQWIVNLTVDKKRLFIGGFKDLEAAELVAHLAREKYHGNFARHI
jgi:hypothetical protein